MGMGGLVLTFAGKVGMACMCIWALQIVAKMKDQWMVEIKDVDVYTIHMDEFWGPVHMLVPQKCKTMDELMAQADGGNSSRRNLVSTESSEDFEVSRESSFLMKKNSDDKDKIGHDLEAPVVRDSGDIDLDGVNVDDIIQRNMFTGHVILPKGMTRHEFVNLIQLHKCGQSIEEDDPTSSQNYWAMIFLAVSKNGNDDLATLQKCRSYMFWLLAIGMFIDLIMQALIPVVQMVQKSVATPGTAMYTMIDEQEKAEAARTCGDKVCMYVFLSLPMEAYKKLISMTQQAACCALFVTYWHEDHYIMNYIPGMGFVYLYAFYPLMCCAGICGSAGAAMEGAGTALAGCCAVGLVCYMCFLIPCVLIPIFGWSFYNLNYLYQTNVGGVMAGEQVFSVAFPSMMSAAGHASKCLIGANVVEMFVGPALLAFT